MILLKVLAHHIMEKRLVIGTSAYAVITEEEEAFDIDTPTDFLISESSIFKPDTEYLFKKIFFGRA